MGRVRFVVSVEDNAYFKWQHDLLVFNLSRVYGTEYELVTPVAEDGHAPVTTWPGDAVRHERWETAQPLGYAPFNRSIGLTKYLAGPVPDDQVLCIIDPDFLFLTKLHEPGVAAADFCDPLVKLPRRQTVSALFAHNFKVPLQVSCVPYWLTAGECRRVIPRLMEVMLEIRAVGQGEWVTEMYAFNIVTAELGIVLQETHDTTLMFDTDLKSLLHYSHGSRAFDKRSYKPWARIATTEDSPRPLMEMVRWVDMYRSGA